MARPKGTSNQSLTKTVSIQSQVIAANAKVETVLFQLEKLPEVFAAIKAEVETSKGEMDLGLKQYEAEIQEKIVSLEDSLEVRKSDVANTMLSLDNDLQDRVNSMKKSLEELQYSNKLAIERENLDTANVIANKKGLGLYPLNIETQHQVQLDTLKKESEVSLKIAVSSAVKNAKEEMASQIAELTTTNKLINNDLIAASKQVANLESQIEYLKEQVDAARKATVDALAAAKVNVQQTNQGK